MTFTLENTKDAVTCWYSEFHKQMVIFTNVDGNYQALWLDGEVRDATHGEAFASKDTIELSRPHNETREHWTTNGVTTYAQPQGNEMDIKTLIPIDFSVEITPAVDGDLIWDDIKKESYELCDFDTSVVNETWRKGFPNLFVVSFADRPNAGKQPVGNNVVVDTKWSEDYSDESNNEAQNWDWSHCDIKSWKPNHAAMLKQWQAEQNKATGTLGGPGGNGAKEWPSCDSQENMGPGVELSDLELPDPSVDEGSDGSRIGSIGNILHNMSCSMTDENEQSEFGAYASFCWELGVKLNERTSGAIAGKSKAPTFTQAQCDAGELPAVGVECMVKKHFQEECDFNECFIIGFNEDSDWLVFSDYLGNLEQHNINNGVYVFKPIQTAEEKLFDAVMLVLNEACSCVDRNNAKALLASDKFTITLKG